MPADRYADGAVARSDEGRVAHLTRVRVSLGIAAIALLVAVALGPATLTAQVTSGFGPITVLDNTFVSAPGNPELQHNVPRLSVTVGADTLTADFQEFYGSTGGLQRWGFPTSEVHIEESGTLTQYYQRGVVDFHLRPDLGNIYVLERRLTWDYFGGGVGGSPDLGVEPGTVNHNSGEQLGPWNHKVSNFSVGGRRTGFLDFFNAFGGVQAFGFPKTEARIDTNAPGTVHIAAATTGFIRQYFQSAVMEYHQADSQAPVKLRLLGDDLRNQKYPADAWRSFGAFNAAVQLTIGQIYTPEIINFTAPAPTPAVTAATTAPPVASPAPVATPDPLVGTGELIVVGTTDGGILTYDGGHWRQLDVDRSVLSTNRVNAVLVDKDGQIWAGTDAGVFRMDRNGEGAGFRISNTDGGIGSDDIIALAGRQHLDTIWMAHPDRGASSFGDGHWDRIRPDTSSLPSSEVSDVHVVSEAQGRVWFATANGAALFDQALQTWTLFNTGNSDLPSNDVTAIEIDGGGALWFGTKDEGVTRTLNLQAWDQFTTGEGLGRNDVRDILVARNGTVWVATEGGVSRFENGVFFTSNIANSGLPSNSVHELAEDSRGHIWAATDGGVSRYDGSNWISFTKESNGLPTNNTTSITIARAR